jgi:tetratricopeptide (TPR) repeat protein
MLLAAAVVMLCASPVAAVQTGGMGLPDSVPALVVPSVVVADSLFFGMDPLGALDRLEARLEVAPRDEEARWRAARAALALGLLEDDPGRRLQWLRVADQHGDSALALDPNDTDALAWSAAVTGRLALAARGAREKVRLGQEVWDLTHRLLAIDPDDALAHDVLGKLNLEILKLSGLQRFMARVFLGSDPIKRASWEDAERHLRAAIASDPTVVLFYLDMGEMYRHQERREEAIAAYRAGLAVPDLYPPDEKFKRDLRTRLGWLGG